MKKITSLLLVMVMILSLALPVFAGETETLNDRLLELTQDGTIEINGGTIFWREFNDIDKTIKLFEDVIRYYENEGTSTDNVQLILNALVEYKDETGENTVKYFDIRDGKLITDINKAEAYLVIEVKDNDKETVEKHFNDLDALLDFAFEVYTQAHEGWMAGDTITGVNGIVIRNFIMGTDPEKEFPITEVYGVNQDVVIQEGLPSATNSEANSGKGFFLHYNPTPSELMNASNMSFIIQNQTGIDFKTVDSGEFYIGINTIGKNTDDEFVMKVIYNVNAIEIIEEDIPESQIDIVEDVIKTIPKAKPPVEVPVTVTPNTDVEENDVKPIENPVENTTDEPIIDLPDDEIPDNKPEITPEEEPESIIPKLVPIGIVFPFFLFPFFWFTTLAGYSFNEFTGEKVKAKRMFYKLKKDGLHINITRSWNAVKDGEILFVPIRASIKGRMTDMKIFVSTETHEAVVDLLVQDKDKFYFKIKEEDLKIKPTNMNK